MSGHRQQQFGDNPYTCEEYGRTRAEIKERSKAYIDRYGIV